MANGQINKLLELVNMQMAAEAFLARANDSNLPPANLIVDRLEQGNGRSKYFTPTQAADFTSRFQVLRPRT